MTDKHLYTEALSSHRLLEVSYRFVRTITLKVVFLRSNKFEMHEDSRLPFLLITPKKTYIPSNLIKEAHEESKLFGKSLYRKAMDMAMRNFQNEYTADDENINMFSEEACIKWVQSMVSHSAGYKMKKMNTVFDLYLTSNMLAHKDHMKGRLRFSPLSQEEVIIRKWIKMGNSAEAQDMGSLSLKTLKTSLALSDEFQNLISRSYEDIFGTKMQRIKEEALTAASDFQTVLTSLVNEELTYPKFKFWERSRHNLFGSVFEKIRKNASSLDEVEHNFDVNIPLRFNYFGSKSEQTPDMVEETEAVVKIYDFAVTTIDPGRVVDIKKSKYDDLKVGLSRHLKKEVTVDAIVWRISGSMEFQIPQEFSGLHRLIWDDPTIKFLREIHLRLSMDPNYSKYRTLSEKEFLETEDMDYSITEPLNKILVMRARMAKKFKTIKVNPMEASRKDYSKIQNNRVPIRTTSWYKKVVEDNKPEESFNPYVYSTKVESVLTKIHRQDLTPETLKGVFNTSLKDVKSKLISSLKAETEKRFNYEKMGRKIPKLFKIPVFSKFEKLPEIYEGYVPSWFLFKEILDDGTAVLDTNLNFKEQLEEEEEESNKDYMVDGLGINIKEDNSLIQDLLYMMREDREINENDSYSDSDNQNILSLRSKKIWELLETFSEVAFNLCYLEGRRNLSKDNKKTKVKFSNSVIKNFGSYFLLVKGGSAMTQQKQMRFKIITKADNSYLTNNNISHSWEEFPHDSSLVQTNWLTMSLVDLRHFIRVKEVACMLASSYMDKMKEMNRGKVKPMKFPWMSLMSSLLILLEHKRGTSTTLQLNRYLLHSATSFISNKKSMVEDISSSPIRSRLEAYIRVKQIRWYNMAMDRVADMQKERVSKMYSKSSSYDRFSMPSFFDSTSEVEFSVLMDEMYTGNMFDKEMGFTAHRLKQIVNKMTEAEMKFQKIKATPESQGNIKLKNMANFLLKKDTLHTFDSNWVKNATRMFFSSETNQPKVAKAMLNATSSVIDGAMMMSASLKSGPYNSSMLEFTDQIEKDKTFITLFREVNKLNTSVIMEMCSKMDEVDALFTIFPKPQIGGPREILIMHVKLRFMVKFLETISKELCSIHPKEMLTKDRLKADLQSSKMAEYKETLQMLKGQGKKGIVLSLNADSSKWAPGFVMEHFSVFVENFDIPREIKDFLHAVLSSFSHKTILVPEVLKEKWAEKPSSQKDYLEGIQKFREMTVENGGFVDLNSGMGQGMLHFMSSFYHAVMEDYSDFLVERMMLKLHNTTVKSTTLLSSDDKTKLLLFIFETNDPKPEETLSAYVKFLDMTSRLANIHINWKKSGLNLIICEFNSLFSVGKRMLWATIKDIYNAHLLPDLTSPEEAVVFMLSNIRRCMEHGMFYDSLKLAMYLARKLLMKCYRYDDKVVNTLCMTLNCKEEQLPFNLGFVPETYAFETLVFGPELNYFDHKNSDELNKFYSNLHSALQKESINKGKKIIPFVEESSGKFWIELPTRLDKRLKELKDSFFSEELMLNKDDVMKVLEENSLNINLKKTDPKNHFLFTSTFFIGMNRKYEFQETMVVHSLVRALQMARGKAQKFPLEEKTQELMEDIRDLTEELKKKKENPNSTFDEIEAMSTELLLKKAEESKSRMSVQTFCEWILNMDKTKSSLFFYKALDGITIKAEKAKEKLLTLKKSYRFSHPVFRPIKFYLSENLMDVKPKDLLEYMFDPFSNPRNKTIQAMEIIRQMSGLDEWLFHNPFLYIKKMFKKDDFFCKAFKDFLNLTLKSFKNLKISMMSDFACKGNSWDNMEAWYRHKFDPSCVFLEDLSEWQESKEDLTFLTNMSLKGNPGDMVINDEFTTIRLSDNPVTRTKKLHLISNGKPTNTSIINYNRVEYRRYKNSLTEEVKEWCNYNSLIKTTLNKNKEMTVYITTNKDFWDSSSAQMMKSLFMRYLREIELSGITVKDGFKDNKDAIFEDKLNFYVVHNTLFYKTILKQNSSVWTLHSVVSTNPLINLKNAKDNNQSTALKLLSDKYTIDTESINTLWIQNPNDTEDPIKLIDMIREPPDIKTLNNVFKHNKWIDSFKISERGAENNFNYMDMDDIMDSFGFSGVEQTIMSTLGAITDMANLESQFDEDPEPDQDLELDMAIKDNFGMELTDIKEALMGAEKEGDTLSESSLEEQTFIEKASLIRVMDDMISRSLSMEVSIKKDEMMRFVRYLRKQGRSFTSFHNLLFNQVHSLYNNELEDSMSVILYSIILRSNMSTVKTASAKTLKKINNSSFTVSFLEKIEESNDRFLMASLEYE